MEKNQTPLNKQYNQIKAKYPDTILLFRLGDFFETFDEDAEISSRICGLTLTKRNNGAAGDQPMAGFPHHQLDNYLPKLVRAGYRVAVCDQLEDPALAKGIVKRGVVEVITPGVAIGDKILEARENNYVMAVYSQLKRNYTYYGIAFADISTGEFQTCEVSAQKFSDIIEVISPKEIIISKSQKTQLTPQIESLKIHPYITKLEDWFFEEKFANDLILNHFKLQNLKSYGLEQYKAAIIASGALLHYINENQQGNTSQIQKISIYNPNEFILLDFTTRKNLEILFSLSENEQGNTLLKIIDNTITSMGSRLLKHWLVQPLINVQEINLRLETVEEFYNDIEIANNLRKILSNIGDLERLLSKISANKINPRDFIALKNSLREIPNLKILKSNFRSELLNKLISDLQPNDNLVQEIERAIDDEPSLNFGLGKIFKKGYSAELDEYTELKFSSNDWLEKYQEQERQKTGIGNLRVSFNNVFGYFIEVSKANVPKVPDYYERRQTLTNYERYITPELKEFENKILEAESKLSTLERELLERLRLFSTNYIAEIQANSQIIATLDCLSNFAVISKDYNYTKPEIDTSNKIEIIDGRHPIIERSMKIGEKYIENSTVLNDEQMIHILTGPNMSGKSSYLRQVGLIILLGQIGCFVPAKSAHWGYVDNIFTRVGASDNIIGGESTFMVEMGETAKILNNATDRSLILLDEVGRGTATFDGISIAWAIAEYIHNIIQAKTLFATHYHELQELENAYKKIKNYKIEVIETGSEVLFTHKLTEGASDNSFGIHVAKMAGLPTQLIERAEEILETLLSDDSTKNTTKARKPNTKAIHPKRNPPYQLSFFELQDHELRDKIASIDPEKLTPLEALQILYDLKKMLNI
ncbi:MAG TPA: DNA mismatch repair protein MutS [Candidatus Kapabacteria bacterium]|nr:DNA mismatch repair protein MutS [Candidatus Kapabacteria bacterium]